MAQVNARGMKFGVDNRSSLLHDEALNKVTLTVGGQIIQQWDSAPSTVAAAGSSASDATALTQQRSAVTGATGATGVALPAASAGLVRTILNTSPVFPLLVYPVNGGNDNINSLAEDLPYSLGPGIEATFTAVSATQWYVPDSGSGLLAHPSQKFVFRDDFYGTWLITDAAQGPADFWIGTAGNGTSNQTATTVAAALGGVITLKSASDDGAITANMTALTSRELAYKANAGGLAMEVRLKVDAITDVYIFVGFSDTISSTLEEPIFLNAADIDSTATDACGILFDTDGTTSDLWLHGGVKNNTDTTPAYATVAPTAPVADTYVVLRVEVDTAGGVRGFVNGVPIGATVANAVTATVALCGGIWLANRGAAQRIVSIDYIQFEQNRV
jgi:hypothetical protein